LFAFCAIVDASVALCPDGRAWGWGDMRDIVIRRRALLALAVGVFAAAWGAPSSGAASERKQKPDLPPRPPRPAPHIIVLDPGHGGADPGAISPHGIYEKAITLATARELAHQLEGSGRYRPVLTRNRDVLVPLRERVMKARRSHAELLLSVHADA